MKKTIGIILIVILVLLVVYWGYISMYEGFAVDRQATYNVKFITNWGADPLINHPSNPHTGNMFLVTHNNNFKLFEVGKLASRGVSQTSMYGTIDDLNAMTSNNPNIGNIVTANVLEAPGEANLQITANSDKPILSFVTMIAPSSDWFTGFTLNLIENGKWIDKMELPLYVFVAGTDSNQGFVTKHILRNVPEPIRIKNDKYLFPDGKLKPIAHAIITKMM
jgi:hypothetical protein